MALGVLSAISWYFYESHKASGRDKHSWTIILSALFFGSLGAKLLTASIYVRQYDTFGFVQFLYSGRSIIGGLIGGWIGVVLAKRCFKIRSKHGNAIAPAAALGMAIGRLGCFLGSCCYGIPTTSWVGIDFGDGIRRHPTQLYEAIFDLGLFAYFSYRNRSPQPPGILFRQFLMAYFVFRVLIEFIRTEPRIYPGLSVFQVLSLIMLGVLAWGMRKHYQTRGGNLARSDSNA
jgi:phosphatidylglycerol:prolipoprotein diacylglycerol transferase